MLRKVEVRTGMNSLHLLEAERHFEFDVCCRVGVVGKLLMVVEAVFAISQTEVLVPFEARLTPEIKPFQFFS